MVKPLEIHYLPSVRRDVIEILEYIQLDNPKAAVAEVDCFKLSVYKINYRIRIANVAIKLAIYCCFLSIQYMCAHSHYTFNPIGYLMLLAAVVSYSLYAVFAQKAVEFSSTEKTYIMLALGAISFTGTALVENAIAGTLKEFAMLPFTNVEFLIAVLYLSIGCSVVAFLFYITQLRLSVQICLPLLWGLVLLLR